MSKKILLINNDKKLIKVIDKIKSELNFELDIIYDSLDYFNIINEYNIVIADVFMHKPNGFDIKKIIDSRKDLSKIKVFLTSNYDFNITGNDERVYNLKNQKEYNDLIRVINEN